MSIIEKIRNFWKKRNQKALPEAQITNEYNTNVKKNKKWILHNAQYNQPTKLDMEIDAFLHSYSNIIENADIMLQPINTRTMAYQALVTMAGKPVTQEEFNQNYYNEQELLEQLYNNGQYAVEQQGTRDMTTFYHVKSVGYQMPQFNDMLRVYINCNNGNISELSNLILSYNENPNFYMKFTSNLANSAKPRGEKIVIYCDKNDIDYTLQLVQYTKSIRPDLYKESENVLPFLQSIDNTVSVSKQPITDKFIDLYGNSKTIVQSTNSFLSTTLKDSYVEAVKEIARADANLSFLLQNECLNDEYLYMKNYPYINSNYHDYLIQSMKAKMSILSINNDLYIEGLDRQYQRDVSSEERNNNQDYREIYI